MKSLHSVIPDLQVIVHVYKVCVLLVLVRFEDLLAVSDSSIYILHVKANPHGLIHHVEHVDVRVIEDGSHLFQALFTHFQQLTRGCNRVKAALNTC